MGTRSARGDGPVMAVVERRCARAGIIGILVNGGEEKTVAPADDGLGAVAVMGVKIPYGDAGGAELGTRVECGEGNLVEITKTHRLPRGRVMAGRARERESWCAMRERVLGGSECGTDSAAGVVADAGEERSVGVKVAGLREAFEMSGRVSEEQSGVADTGGWCGGAPRPVWMRGAQVRCGTRDARRLLWVHRGAVVGTLRVVMNQHRRNGRKKAQRAQELKVEPGGTPDCRRAGCASLPQETRMRLVMTGEIYLLRFLRVFAAILFV